MHKIHFFYHFGLVINLFAFFIIQLFVIFTIISYIDNIEIVIDLLINTYQKIHSIIGIIGEKIIFNIYNYLING